MWESVRDLIPHSIKKAGIGRQISDALVCEEFNKIASHVLGSEAEHCRAMYLKDRELWVAVLSGAVSNELKLYEPDILRALGEVCGEGRVEALRFLV